MCYSHLAYVVGFRPLKTLGVWVYFPWNLHPGKVFVLESYPIYHLCVVRIGHHCLDIWTGEAFFCLGAWCSPKMLAASRINLGILFRTYST